MSTPATQHLELRIQAGPAWLDAFLTSPAAPQGLILCLAPALVGLRDSREQQALRHLHAAGFASLLVSLLTPYEEAHDADLRYDIACLAQRTRALLTWASQQPALAPLPVAMQASDTAAAAMIREAAEAPGALFALVSRAGRADLAGASPLRKLALPLLMQVPEGAPDLLRASEQAYALLSAPRHWQALSSAEPEAAALAACDWLTRHRSAPAA